MRRIDGIELNNRLRAHCFRIWGNLSGTRPRAVHQSADDRNDRLGAHCFGIRRNVAGTGPHAVQQPEAADDRNEITVMVWPRHSSE